MDDFRRLIQTFVDLILRLGDLIIGALVVIELWIRGQLMQLGLPANVQAIILLATAVILIVAALRMFGGLVRVAVIVLLLLITMHAVAPLVRH